jgi:glutamine synthetase
MTAPQDLVAFVTTDLVALTRGRAVAQSALPGALSKGVGWVPANLALTPFDEIAHPNPFGSSGDLRLMPDPDAGVRVTGPGLRGPLHFYHSDIVNLDGTPWEGCVRALLKSAIDVPPS